MLESEFLDLELVFGDQLKEKIILVIKTKILPVIHVCKAVPYEL